MNTPSNSDSTSSMAPNVKPVSIQPAFHAKSVTTSGVNKMTDAQKVASWNVPGKPVKGYAASMNRGGDLETNK